VQAPKFLDNPSARSMVAYGYRYGEVGLDKIPGFKKELAVLPGRINDPDIRNPMQASLGPVIIGAAPPHPDTTDAATALAGVLKRIGTEPPPADMRVVEELRKFVQKKVREWYPKLPADTDVSFEKWIEETQYSRSRKEELREVYRLLEDPEDPKWEKAKCFIKAETYPQYKHARGIFSRTDQYKCMVGPFFKAIENVVYQDPSFVKHTPVRDRPKHITEVLNLKPGEQVDATDYTSFESLFRAFLMWVCEMELYMWMTEDLPDRDFFWRRLGAMLGDNYLAFKWFVVFIHSTRLSGGMETSLGNGFSNKIFGHFMAESISAINIRMVVEGDDGLLAYEAKRRLKSEDFAKLGLSIKLQTHANIEHASFCGIVFDEQEKRTLCDPRKALASFGWADGRYSNCKISKKRRLLRAKALSLAYQYPGCPILWAVAEYGMRVTRSYNVGNLFDRDRSLSWWDRNKLEMASRQEHIAAEPPGPRSRALVEDLYGISIELQLHIESLFLTKSDFEPIIDTAWLDIFHEDWKHYDLYYCQNAIPREQTRPVIPLGREAHLFDRLIPEDNNNRLKQALKRRRSCRPQLATAKFPGLSHRGEGMKVGDGEHDAGSRGLIVTGTSY
jgi:hypothetical protein